MGQIAEVVVDDTGIGEGPAYCPDGTVIITSVNRGVVYRVHVSQQRKEVFADTAGAPNGVALSSDGGVLVTQSGGLANPEGLVPPGWPPIVGESPACRPTAPGLQRAFADGRVEYVADSGFLSPSCLVVDADGTVYFTDPPAHGTDRNGLVGRIWAYRPDGSCEVVASDFSYCNGIALDLDGRLVVTERNGLQAINRDGSREWIVENLGVGHGDGFCLDVDGRFYVASLQENGVRVIEDGREVDFLHIPGEGVTTDCCFGGTDRRSLFATDAFGGRLVVWENMPTAGLPLSIWPAATV